MVGRWIRGQWCYARTSEEAIREVPGAAGTTVAIPSSRHSTTVQCDGPCRCSYRCSSRKVTAVLLCYRFPYQEPVWLLPGTPTWCKVGEAIGNETLRSMAVMLLLGPGMNLHRNPLCGRNFEYYSEDPIVTGLIGTAFVQGVQSQGVGVSAKHFAVNSSGD